MTEKERHIETKRDRKRERPRQRERERGRQTDREKDRVHVQRPTQNTRFIMRRQNGHGFTTHLSDKQQHGLH